MKKIIILISLSLLIIGLSSCQLAKENAFITPEVDDLDLIGIYFQMVDPTDYETSLLPEFGEEDAFHFYHIAASQGEHDYMQTIANTSVLNLHTKFDVLDNTINGVTTRTQSITYEFDILIGRSHLGHILYIDTIYQDDQPILSNSHSGHMLSDVTMTSTYRDDVIIDNLPTEVIFKVTFQMVDELISVDLIEMDDSHQRIKTTTITEPLSEYTVTDLTSYVIIEQMYQDVEGNTYKERKIVDKDEYVLLHFLNQYDFVTHEGAIHIIF